MAHQPGFFDAQDKMELIKSYDSPLQKLSCYIDFEYFRKELESAFSKDKDYSKGGRPAYDYVLMFKIIILQSLYNISDDQTEFCINDRFSFMQFLGLELNQKVPDAKTIWNFKNELAKKGLVEKLFNKLTKQLKNDGIIVKEGKITDASFIEVPRQRNNRSENEQIKNEEQPEWDENKARQKDVDARWTKKNDEVHYGYKDHIKVDSKTKLIENYIVTDASVHDSNVTNDVIKTMNGGEILFADSAYKSVEIDEKLRKKNIENQIIEKGYRNKPLTKRQIQKNKKKSKTRVRVEHIFGFMENSMNRMYMRCIGMTRAVATIGLMNLTYNLSRLVQLNVVLKS